ncbi:hypothetical protein LOK49_LG13G02955 [Camellia lanceoleosa]|uniref:Uncharacterized protein n=1 Tax=Camellia lanceoleosa TaxID=1840588 RepID=A0ACC0FHM2_9ERIC|nr:hypothetical protein LOK49_LG13G02955 [Camellia lanceoleosa]
MPRKHHSHRREHHPLPNTPTEKHPCCNTHRRKHHPLPTENTPAHAHSANQPPTPTSHSPHHHHRKPSWSTTVSPLQNNIHTTHRTTCSLLKDHTSPQLLLRHHPLQIQNLTHQQVFFLLQIFF